MLNNFYYEVRVGEPEKHLKIIEVVYLYFDYLQLRCLIKVHRQSQWQALELSLDCLLISHLIHIKAIHMSLSIQRYMNGFYYANFDRKEKQVI